MKLDVKSYVDKEYEKLVEFAKKKENLPTLHIIQVGENPASDKYIRNKIKKCCMLGIPYVHTKFSENIKENTLECFVSELMSKEENIKIMVQEPIPNHVKFPDIPFYCDVDGTSIDTRVLRAEGLNEHTYEPATARGILEYMKHLDSKLEGKRVLIINRSKLVGERLKELLLDENMLVKVAHSKVKKEIIEDEILHSDYIISGVGIAEYFNTLNLKPRSVFIDVGINFNKDNTLCGDLKVTYDNDHIYYTPVPGGVGQLTVLSLMKNILDYKEGK